MIIESPIQMSAHRAVRTPDLKPTEREKMSDVPYLTLAQAKAALIERKHMRKEIELWWKTRGWSVPEALHTFGLVAAFGKPAVATRRYEDVLFLEYAKAGGFDPVWMVYNQCAFSSESPFKRRLLHPTFFERRGGRSGNIVTRKQKLAGIEVNRTKPIANIMLDSGVPLVEYHRGLHRSFGLPDQSVINLSACYAQFDNIPREYYKAYLTFFIAHCALVENFEIDRDEETAPQLARFVDEVFLPAHKEISDLFGVAPIIVHFPWHESLQYYVPDNVNNWREHGVIPEHLLDLTHQF